MKPGGKAYYMISAVAQKYNIHPQTLRLYEREGLLKPSRTDGNTRLYSEEDLEQLETILSLTRDLGVNLAGVEIILNMRRKIERMQGEVNEFMEYVEHERPVADILPSSVPRLPIFVMACDLCDDTGWKPVERDGIRRVVRCDCRRVRIGQERLADSNIPKRYQHCTIANFT